MDWQDFAQRMASMAVDLLGQESSDAALRRIVSSSVEIVEGCDSAGIVIRDNDTMRTLASTDGLAAESDRLQEHLGEGPCFDITRAKGGAHVFRIADLTEHQRRWPRYAPAAGELGVGSMMTFLLFADDEEFGALNMYARRPGAFTEVSETAGVLLASHAAVALSGARTYAQMHSALTTRHVIGEAMGIVMERYHLDEDGAFAVLRDLSQKRNVKLRAIAQRVCESGGVED
ncbi:GAF and ANTAR domain-containing protein [Streptomyces sp. NBC_01478]|uniref:GAF and ANTAR domain-containing protein n=1 Tax=Streptomyces sp. NBC_01478 TaxID=2903882 RepID=UPI002E35A4FD|nr:GAF and ANTAR domain-containing protein [Streptomyces sp. NBC_01478]